jgi:hypothetical protein
MGGLRLPWEERRERRTRMWENLVLVALGAAVAIGFATCERPAQAEGGSERDAAARMERLVRAEEAQAAELRELIGVLRRGCR